jgi:hypothetical protein
MNLDERLMAVLEALSAQNITLLPITPAPGGRGAFEHYFVFFRAGYAALVERNENGFGRVGTAGIVTEHGLAMLVEKDGEARFVIRDYEQAPEPGELDELRAFQDDLRKAIQGA